MERGTWDEPYAENYEKWSSRAAPDIPYYVGLAADADGPIVELAVGNGRVAIPVAQATGQRVIGIDRSPVMLAHARRAAAEAGVHLDLRLSDIRDLALDEPASLIYCPARSLLHLPTWTDRRLVFERVAGSLLPGGRFAWNAFVFDHHYAAGADGVHVNEPEPHTVRYDPAESRLDMVMDTGTVSSLWWATKNEWLGLIDIAGLELESLFGGFEGEPFSTDAREFVLITRRPLSET